jgi:hypothetical protein
VTAQGAGDGGTNEILHCFKRPASFEPIVQRSIGPFSEAAFKAPFAPQPGKLACPRSGNNEPFRLDLAVLDDFRPLKDERALASAQFPADSLHAHKAGRFVIAQDLQSPHGCFAFDISGECFGEMKLHQFRALGLVVGLASTLPTVIFALAFVRSCGPV